MRGLQCSILLLMICVCSTSVARAATVKKKNGETIEGQIDGAVVLKRTLGAPTEKSLKGRCKGIVVYVAIGGKYVDTIDENGVKPLPDGYVGLVEYCYKKTPLSDLEVLGGTSDFLLADVNITGVLPVDGKTGTMVITRMKGKDLVAKPQNILIGTCETTSKVGEVRLLPGLTIRTEEGAITVPVEEIIEFKENESPADKQP